MEKKKGFSNFTFTYFTVSDIVSFYSFYVLCSQKILHSKLFLLNMFCFGICFLTLIQIQNYLDILLEISV